MHLVEQYALSCGVKITHPTVECQFFPLPFEKYIILHPSSGMSAKNYSYYTDVLELLRTDLQKNNIHIVQIGAKEDEPLPLAYHLQGVTTLNQTFYLIKNSLLVLGNDSFSSHVAGGFNKKLVSLYSNLYAACCKPFWGDPEQQHIIQADRKGKKPSFSAQEKEKVVDNIKPETIAASVLELLDIEHGLENHETLYIGPKYKEAILEVVPNFTSPPDFPPDRVVNLRMDYLHNPEIMMSWIQKHKTHIVLDRELPLKYLWPVKGNIVKITLELTESISLDYVQQLRQLGCKLEFYALDNDKLADVRVKFLDYEVEKLVIPSKKSLDDTQKICDNTYYVSSKTIYSNGQYYGSKASWMMNRPVSRLEPIIDTEEFWKELDNFRIYNYIA